MRKLKDQKKVINENQIPSLVIILKNRIIFAIFLIIVLSIVDIVYKNKKISLFNDLSLAIRWVNKRQASIASETYQIRKLELLANNLIYSTSDSVDNTKKLINSFEQTLKSSEWKCIDVFLKYENNKGQNTKFDHYPYLFL